MRRLLLQAVGLGTLVVLALGASSCVVATPPVTAEETVIYTDEARRAPVREYYYYPNSQIYFDPGVNVWYWRDGERWYHGRDLPARYHLNKHDRYAFRSDVREPYVIHDRIQREYRDRHYGPKRTGPEFDHNRRYDRHPDGRIEYDRNRPLPPVGGERPYNPERR